MIQRLQLCAGMALIPLCLASIALGQPVQPGEPVDYRPMHGENWKTKGTPTSLYPWEGKHVVILTTKKDFDPAVMGVFVKRLDAGWELYAKLIKRPPSHYNLWKGKSVVAMVPDASYTCGIGCGFIGNTGIEIAGFYHDHFGGPGDYEIVKRNREAFAHYYFYEFGRNWNTFGNRGFLTGFAVFMRNVCMDTLGCVDPDAATRRAIERAEDIYARSSESYLETFDARSGDKLRNAQGKPIPLTDVNCMYASVMLRLRKDYGGNEWLKRFYDAMFECPESRDPRMHALSWVVSASCAAKKDLTPLFVDRWRFPVPASVRQGMAKIDWASADLSPMKVLLSLPVQEIPLTLQVQHPEFVTEELRKNNLLVDSSFEDSKRRWRQQSYTRLQGTMGASTEQFHHGKRSLMIRSEQPNDCRFVQTVPVKPKTRYLLCGWIKTRGVEIRQPGGQSGANLSIDEIWERSNLLVGDHDWTYVAILVPSGDKSQLKVCARLGFSSSVATGQAWFDDLCLIELPHNASPQLDKSAPPTSNPLIGIWDWGWADKPDAKPTIRSFVEFHADGTVTRGPKKTKGKWQRSGKQIKIDWDANSRSKLTLSADKKTLEGTNHLNNAVLSRKR